MPNDLEAIERKWLRLCGCCDAGLPMNCTCPQGDPRNVIADLVHEIDLLKAEVERWRTGLRTRSIRPPALVPDGLEYAARLVRSQGTKGGDAHDLLLRAASSRLSALHDVASQQQDEVDRLTKQLAEAQVAIRALVNQSN